MCVVFGGVSDRSHSEDYTGGQVGHTGRSCGVGEGELYSVDRWRGVRKLCTSLPDGGYFDGPVRSGESQLSEDSCCK